MRQLAALGHAVHGGGRDRQQRAQVSDESPVRARRLATPLELQPIITEMRIEAWLGQRAICRVSADGYDGVRRFVAVLAIGHAFELLAYLTEQV